LLLQAFDVRVIVKGEKLDGVYVAFLKKNSNRLDKYERSFYFGSMSKGEDTKLAILERGLSMASTMGLDLVSIGSLAKATNMSKSGLFAHFQSKENLQVEILKHAGDVFAEKIVIPALRTPAGIPRIRALVANWTQWTSRLKGGCIFVSASSDFTDRPGKVRDFLLRQQEDWLESLRRIAESAIRVGDFDADIDRDQFAYDLYSLLLGFHLYHNLLKSEDTRKHQEKALEQLLHTYQKKASGS